MWKVASLSTDVKKTLLFYMVVLKLWSYEKAIEKLVRMSESIPYKLSNNKVIVSIDIIGI